MLPSEKKSIENILVLFEYTDTNIYEMGYLIDIAKRFEILDMVRESIFQLNPRYDENGRCQTFPVFYKEMLLSDISYAICLEIGKEFYDPEDFALYCQDIWLSNREDNIFYTILMKNNFYTLKKEEIINFFKLNITDVIESYKNGLN